MRIDLREVREVVVTLLDHIIERRGVSEVNIENPFYWVVPEAKKYNMEEKPSDVDIGSLADDWEFLRAILNDKNSAVAYSLTEAAALLSFIGEATARQLAIEGG